MSRYDRVPSESSDQMMVVAWLRRRGYRFHHSPNGGLRSAKAGEAFKAMGTSPGFPDLIILEPTIHGQHSAALELKRERGGHLSEEQAQWLLHLESRGWAVRCCKGATEALAWLKEQYG